MNTQKLLHLTKRRGTKTQIFIDNIIKRMGTLFWIIFASLMYLWILLLPFYLLQPKEKAPGIWRSAISIWSCTRLLISYLLRSSDCTARCSSPPLLRHGMLGLAFFSRTCGARISLRRRRITDYYRRPESNASKQNKKKEEHSDLEAKTYDTRDLNLHNTPRKDEPPWLHEHQGCLEVSFMIS